MPDTARPPGQIGCGPFIRRDKAAGDEYVGCHPVLCQGGPPDGVAGFGSSLVRYCAGMDYLQVGRKACFSRFHASIKEERLDFTGFGVVDTAAECPDSEGNCRVLHLHGHSWQWTCHGSKDFKCNWRGDCYENHLKGAHFSGIHLNVAPWSGEGSIDRRNRFEGDFRRVCRV